MPNSSNDNVQIQGLEFVIKTVSEQAEGIKQVSDGLRTLESSSKKLPETIGGIQRLSGALSGLKAINAEPFQKLADALKPLAEMGKIHIQIPKNFSERLTELSSACEKLNTEKIEKFGNALHSLDGVKFPEGLSKSLSAITSVSSASSQIDAGKLYSIIPALKAFQGLNFNFAPHGLTSSLKEIVSAGNAITNDTVSNLYRLSSAAKMFENFNMTNAGSFKELGDALSSFSYFYIPDGFALSMQYIVDGVKAFQQIGEGDIKKVAQLTNLFNNMPAEEMTNFYNVLDSFGSATRDFADVGNVNFAPLKQVLETISGMDMAGKTAIAPEFIASVKELLNVSMGMDTGNLSRLLETLLDFGKHGKNFNFSFPTGFADFAKEIKTAISLFPEDSFGAGWREFMYQMQTLGEMKGIRSVADLFTAFGKVGEVSVSPDLVTRLKEITEFVKSISNDDIQKIKDYADALKYLGEMSKGVKVPKMAKIETPKVEKPVETSKWKELYEKLPLWGKSLVFIGSTSLKLVWGAIQKVGEVSVSVAKKVFTLKNALGALKLVGNIAVAPVKAIQALDNAIAGIPKRIQKFTSHISKAVKTVQKFAKSIQKTVKDVKKFVSAIGDKLSAPFKNISKKISGFVKSLQRIFMYRMIRSAIRLVTEGFKEGLENLYQYSLLVGSQFHKSMDLMATDALYVKNSLGAMVSPLINAFAPAVDAITDKFVNLLNLVNQTFSALAGKSTYTAAKKVKTEWMDAESSVKESTDKIKRYVLGFDELNILGDKDNSTSSKKEKETPDYLAMFHELPVESTIGDFVKQIRDAIKNSQFYKVGKMIAEKMNEIIKSIPFGNWGEWIGEKINNAVDVAKGFLDFADFVTLGSGVAKFLNKAFEQIEFHNLGAVLAGKIRLALDFAFGFVKEFHFKEFGKDLGQMVSGFIISIDFDKAILTLQWGFEGILDTVYGFLTRLQSFAFGVKIKNALSLVDLEGITSRLGFIAEELQRNFNDFLKGLGIEIDFKGNPFEHLGAFLGTQLTNVFYKIPYDKLGEILGKGIQNVVANARNFWQNLDLTGLGSGIAEFINNAVANVDFYSVGMTIAEKLSTVFNGIASFLNRTDWDSVFESVTLAVTGFFENLDFDKIDFNRIGHSIGKFLDTAFKNIGNFLKELDTRGMADTISGFLDSVFSEIKLENFMSTLNWLVIDILDFVAELIEETDFGKIGETIGKALAGIDWGGLLYETGRVIVGVFKGIWGLVTGTLDGLATSLQEKLPKIENPFYLFADWLGGIAKSIFDGWVGFWENFGSSTYDVLHKISGWLADRGADFGVWMSGIETKFNTHVNNIANWFNSFPSKIHGALNKGVGWVEGFVNAWVTGFNDISDVINNALTFQIPDWVPYVGGNSWSPNLPKFEPISIPRFDKGGFPNSGDLFFANENGSPELVGRMGSQTTVANNEQIVQGIAEGVMMAMNSGSQNQLIRQAITILQAIAEKDPVVEVTTNSIDKAKNRQNLRNGVLS